MDRTPRRSVATPTEAENVQPKRDEHKDESTLEKSRMARRAGLGSSVGTIIETYDFQIFATASALVFSQVFFTANDPAIGIMLSFATFAVGFLIRPIGGIVFGHFGDRLGRKNTLIAALVGSGTCTFLMGVLPGYDQVGLLAPILLLTLRLIQGFFHGGEQGGAMVMAAEHAPAHRRGWYSSWALIGAPGGTLVGAAVMAITVAATGENFVTWGWRIPFLASALLIGIGLYIRFKVTETPAFARTKAAGQRTKAPIISVFRDSWKQVLLGAGVNFGFNTFMYVLITFSQSYTQQTTDLHKGVVLNGILAGSGAAVIAMLFFARLSDRVGRLPVMASGAGFMALYAYPLFWMIDSGNTTAVIIAIILGFTGSAALFGPMGAFLVELFKTNVGYSGVSLGYQIGTMLGGGLAPLIATALASAAGGLSWPVSGYLVCASLVSLASLFGLTGRTTTTQESTS